MFLRTYSRPTISRPTMIRQGSRALILALPVIATACAGPPVTYPAYPSYAPYPGALPPPVPTELSPSAPTGLENPGAPMPEMPSGPDTDGIAPPPPPVDVAPIAPLTAPDAAAPATPAAPGGTPPAAPPPGTETPASPSGGNATPGQTNAPAQDGRFQALKNSLEKNTPTAPASNGTPSAASGCTKVHMRPGYHDHYGGLNSSGDVLPSCSQ